MMYEPILSAPPKCQVYIWLFKQVAISLRQRRQDWTAVRGVADPPGVLRQQACPKSHGGTSAGALRAMAGSPLKSLRQFSPDWTAVRAMAAPALAP